MSDSGISWAICYQLGHMQVCTLLQTDNHTSTPPLCFLHAGCPSCCPTNSVKALKAQHWRHITKPGQYFQYFGNCKSTQTALITRKTMLSCTNATSSVQFLLRQHGSFWYRLNELFAASRESCGGLTACIFLVVFRLAVKISSSFTATSATIQLAGYRLQLVGVNRMYL